MGVFPRAATMNSLLTRPRGKASRHWWPALLWQRCTLDILPSPSHIRATAELQPSRASVWIHRAPLSRIRSTTSTTLRRWMLPVFERGPPVHGVMFAVV
jgi:hypothetical protein